MINACIIGISGFGRVHYADLIRQTDRGLMRPVGATVINQADEPDRCEALRTRGCRIYADHHEMLRDLRGKIDLCFIPTGIPLHASMTIAALKAGANVFVEKPAAATVQDVRAMADASAKAGRFVAVGFQTFYASETTVMKEAILEGRIGKLKAIKCRGLWPRPDSYYARNGWAGRLKCKEGWVLDSPFNNAIAHQLNMICYLAGPDMARAATLAWIEAELYRANPIESTDTAAMRIMTTEGVPLYFFVTHCPEALLDPEIVVEGDKGRIHWTFTRYRIEYADGRAVEGVCDTHTALRDRIMARLRDRVEGRDVLVCDLGIAGTQTLAVNGAHDAATIHTIDASATERRDFMDAEYTVIRGIDAAIDRGFREGKLFSEMDVHWACEKGRISLAGYTAFRGGR